MKKLKTSLLVLVLTSSIAVTNAQQKKDTMKTKEIEGVVVTALGIKREEKSLSYANQTVKAKDLNLTQNVDVKNSIVGKVAGVQLNGQAGSKLGETGKLRLRGAVSLLNDADPIYVLDGVIVDPNTIDMDIVESVNVLKGPNATSLYGVRAQYGVIVMTTKKRK
ncbi:TonB-dependent receptor plug domain-containing protein [Chryseobacterium sp. P1-3]|uniref:TonB-dependent receptor plug domain-containing protein n=1 Tax=Chryseobacterium sp. (strain P1-3) TaxID=1517683 RepID=UPI0006795506|nr:TonB-dependent receptor plug domain-containing protein [Chryseobacterium sp. P1-3]